MINPNGGSHGNRLVLMCSAVKSFKDEYLNRLWFTLQRRRKEMCACVGACTWCSRKEWESESSRKEQAKHQPLWGVILWLYHLQCTKQEEALGVMSRGEIAKARNSATWAVYMIFLSLNYFVPLQTISRAKAAKEKEMFHVLWTRRLCTPTFQLPRPGEEPILFMITTAVHLIITIPQGPIWQQPNLVWILTESPPATAAQPHRQWTAWMHIPGLMDLRFGVSCLTMLHPFCWQ